MFQESFCGIHIFDMAFRNFDVDAQNLFRRPFIMYDMYFTMYVRFEKRYTRKSKRFFLVQTLIRIIFHFAICMTFDQAYFILGATSAIWVLLKYFLNGRDIEIAFLSPSLYTSSMIRSTFLC